MAVTLPGIARAEARGTLTRNAGRFQAGAHAPTEVFVELAAMRPCVRRAARLHRALLLGLRRRGGVGRDGVRVDRADPLAQRHVAEASVDAGVVRLGAAVAVARVADEAQRAGRR